MENSCVENSCAHVGWTQCMNWKPPNAVYLDGNSWFLTMSIWGNHGLFLDTPLSEKRWQTLMSYLWVAFCYNWKYIKKILWWMYVTTPSHNSNLQKQSHGKIFYHALLNSINSVLMTVKENVIKGNTTMAATTCINAQTLTILSLAQNNRIRNLCSYCHYSQHYR